MKIAIDIDGTIYDTERNFRVQSEIYEIEELHKNTLSHPKEMWAQDRYEWTETENINFLKKFVDISEKSNLVPGAKEIIQKIQKMGIETIIITARGAEDNEDNHAMIKVMEDKFKEDGLEFSKIYWGICKKAETCKKENCDFIIDDSPIVCKHTSENGVKTIFLKDTGTENIEPNDNLIEVHNWGEIYRLITEMKIK